jgi:response regulator RpfG family c-di-GMP phosphodiesterase
MNETMQSAILCVDDEPQVLAGLSLHLRSRYEVLTATSGAAGLAVLKTRRDVVAVMSDMRMPVMDGATFLHAARTLVPDAPRLLLTGNADVDSAIAAVNNGQIFRFLVKPCPPDAVLASLQAACEQHRLITAERVLLGKTLNGTIKALTDVLSMSNPLAFGQASRTKQLAGELAERVLPQHRWAVEMAAMLAPIGSIALPDSVIEKMYGGQEITLEERRMIARTPALTESLLDNIPRLELVRSMLALVNGDNPPAEFGLSKDQVVVVQRGADILRVALDFDALDASAYPTDTAIGTLRSRAGRYDPSILAALDEVRGAGVVVREIREIQVAALREGMVIAADVRLINGALLIARGFEVTPSLVERIRNLHTGNIASPVRVYTRR